MEAFVETASESQRKGLQPLNPEKYHFDTPVLRQKLLIRTIPEGFTEGIASGRLWDDQNEVIRYGLYSYNHHPTEKNFLHGNIFHGRGIQADELRTVLCHDMGCEILPKRVLPFKLKRNSHMLQAAIANKKIPKHVRKFLCRNTSRVDGLRWKSREPVRVKRTLPTLGSPILISIIESALQTRNWPLAERAYALLLKHPKTCRVAMSGMGLQILLATNTQARALHSCIVFLGSLMLEYPWLRHHNRTANTFTRYGLLTLHMRSHSIDFFRSLVILTLKLGGSASDLLQRMDDEMMVPPFSVDPVLMYLRGIVLLRCVFDTLKRQKVLTPESLTWLVRAKGEFEASHELGTDFDVDSYVRLAQNVAETNPHGGEGAIMEKNDKLSTKEDKQLLISAASDNQGASSDLDSQSGDAVPWWETLNDSEGDSDDDGEEEEDEIIADDESVARSDTNVKAEESVLEVGPDTPSSPTPMSAGTGTEKEELDYNFESDFDDLTVEPQVTVKPEPPGDNEFDFDTESDSVSDEPVVKPEPLEPASPGRTPLSPVIPIKQERDDHGFATLDDLLGSIPDKKSSRDKKKKKKKKRDHIQDDDDFDFDF